MYTYRPAQMNQPQYDLGPDSVAISKLANPTLVSLAQELSDALTGDTRADGSKFVRFKNQYDRDQFGGEWKKDVMWQVDSQCNTDLDWAYTAVRRVVQHLAEPDRDASYNVCAHSLTELEPDVYHSDLLDWVRKGSHFAYCDEVMENLGTQLSFFQLLMSAQSDFFQEVGGIVLVCLEDELEERQ